MVKGSHITVVDHLIIPKRMFPYSLIQYNTCIYPFLLKINGRDGDFANVLSETNDLCCFTTTEHIPLTTDSDELHV